MTYEAKITVTATSDQGVAHTITASATADSPEAAYNELHRFYWLGIVQLLPTQ